MRAVIRLFSLFLLFILAGCGGSGSAQSPAAPVGAVSLNLDLSTLSPASKTGAKEAGLAATTISAVTVTITREGHTPISAELSVTNNIATGRIDNLAVGYWHLSADVFSADTKIYTGETDVEIVAGAEAQAAILFDPVVVTPTTGAIRITVGMNPMPGYKAVNQQVSKIFYNDLDAKTYIHDAAAGLIAVYDAETMIRERNITLPQAPLAIALADSKDSFYLGYASGKVYKLDIQNGTSTLLGDVLAEVTFLQQVNGKYLLVLTKGGYYLSSYVKVLDLATGQVVASQYYYDAFSDLVRNPTNGMIYAQDSGVSPQDLHRIQIDPATGAISALTDSRYHGDYYYGSPLRIINNGTRIVAASGKTFFSSTGSTTDITFAGSLGYSYVDAATDDTLSLLYLLSITELKKLLIMQQDNFFVNKTVDLLGNPKYLYHTGDNIVIFTQKDNEGFYVKVFKKTDLGLK